jgi:hypothetical protein
MTEHVLIEIRNGRDNQKNSYYAQQFLTTLPDLNNGILAKLSKKSEKLSLEIFVENQSIFFAIYCPRKLLEYLKNNIIANYPESFIKEITYDPLQNILEKNQKNNNQLKQDELENQKKSKFFLETFNLKLKNKDYLPIKTYQSFDQIDPMAPLLTTISKVEKDDQIYFQFLIKSESSFWRTKIQAQINNDQNHPQSSLISQKLSKQNLRSSIKVAILTTNENKTKQISNNICASFQNYNLIESNSFIKDSHFLTSNLDFLQSMIKRSFQYGKTQHLSVEELATIYHFPNNQLINVPNIAWGKNLLGEPPENLPVINRDIPKEIKKDINVFAECIHKNTSMKYGLKRKDRRRHIYVIGKTGTGKSTLLSNMAINDLKNDEGLCFIDPHGDAIDALLDYIPSRRINDVIYINPADPEKTVKINLFEGENIQHRELIASGIVSIFKKLYGYSWGPRLEYILRNVLLTLLKSKEARLSDIVDILTNKTLRKKITSELDDPILRNFWFKEFEPMQDRQKTESIAPILNKVGQFVSSPLIRNVVNAPRSSFSIENAMNEGKIMLVNLSQGLMGEDNATLLGAMLITKIQLAAMARVHTPEEKRKDFYLYVDEFQNFATDSFVKILSEARKYRLSLILANQYISQIPEEVQKAIFGNCGSMISFVMGSNDAKAFESEYGGKYSYNDLVSLSKYQIINKIAIDNIISQPFPAFTLPLAKSSNKNREKVIKVSRERYATNKL